MPELLLESIYLAGDGEVEEREGLFLRDAAKESLQSRAVRAAPCMRDSDSQLHSKETINCLVIELCETRFVQCTCQMLPIDNSFNFWVFE